MAYSTSVQHNENNLQCETSSSFMARVRRAEISSGLGRSKSSLNQSYGLKTELSACLLSIFGSGDWYSLKKSV